MSKYQEVAAPAYLRLYRTLRESIEKGDYPYRAKLPSKRTLAAENNVSVVTAEHAYALLCDEGYAESREKSGYYVCYRPSDGFAGTASTVLRGQTPFPDVQKEEPEITEGAGEGAGEGEGEGEGADKIGEAGERGGTMPESDADRGVPQFPETILFQTMRRVISERGSTALYQKSPNRGMPEFREAIARYLARSRGIRVTPEQIVVGSGAEYLYGLIAALLGREKLYAVEFPSYRKIEQVYRAEGARCERLPLGSDGIETTALWASHADVLHISPYRSFPSGVTATASKKQEYLNWAASRAGERWIIEDDFESEFSVSKKPEETLFSRASDGSVVYLNTFSKTVSPALRVGYMVLPERLTAPFERRLGFYSCTVPVFEQCVLTSLIDNGDFERHINRVRRYKRQPQFRCGGYSPPHPSGAF